MKVSSDDPDRRFDNPASPRFLLELAEQFLQIRQVHRFGQVPVKCDTRVPGRNSGALYREMRGAKGDRPLNLLTVAHSVR